MNLIETLNTLISQGMTHLTIMTIMRTPNTNCANEKSFESDKDIFDYIDSN